MASFWRSKQCYCSYASWLLWYRRPTFQQLYAGVIFGKCKFSSTTANGYAALSMRKLLISIYETRRATLIILILPIIYLIMRSTVNYCFGYYEMPYSLLQLRVIFGLVGLIVIPLLMITWIVTMIQKKNCLWITVMLIWLLAMAGLACIIPNANELVIYGMRNRIRRDYGLDVLRHFARDFDQLPRLPTNLPGTGKIYMNLDLAMTGLQKKYSFLTWMKEPGGFSGPSVVDEADGVVDVAWGGAIAGHWGFSVGINGKKIGHEGSHTYILRMSDDIYFAIEP